MLTLLFSLALAQDAAAPPSDAPVVEKEKQKVSMSFTEDFEFRWREMYLDELQGLEYVSGPQATYFEQVNRFIAQGNVGRWTFGVQVDEGAVWGMPYVVDGEVRTDPPDFILQGCTEGCLYAPFGNNFYANPEKFWLRYAKDDISLDFGDFYASYGYATALALNRNVEVDIDTSIQGARMTWTPGAWEFSALAGQTNRQQLYQDNPLRNTMADFRHFVGAMRLTRYGLGPADVTVHGVVYNFTKTGGIAAGFQELGTLPDAVVTGANAQMYGVMGLDLGLEANLFAYPDAEGFTGEKGTLGYTLYGSATAYVGSSVWLLEVRRFKDHQHPNYATGDETYPVLVPPTLEYERAIVNKSGQATLGSNDIWGGRLKTDFVLGPLLPYVSFAYHRDEDLDGVNQESPSPENVYNTVIGSEYLADHWSLLINGGVRVDDRDDPEMGEDVLVHGDMALGFPIHGEFHGDLAFAARRFWYGETKIGEHEDYSEVETALTLGYTNLIQLVGSVDYSRNPYAGSRGNLAPDVYSAVEIWVRPAPAWLIRAFYGAQKAGLRCSGGQCRQVPSFNGARIAVTGNF